MTTIMILGLIIMIARLSMRIGLILLVIWGVIRLIDRWRFAPVAAPVATKPIAQPVAASVTTEVKE